MTLMARLLVAITAALLAAAPAHARVPLQVFFDSGSSRLDEYALATLDNVAVAARSEGARGIVIRGHADRVGDRGSNLRLSRRRAEAVRDALLARGVSAGTVITTAAVGETDPLIETADGVAERQNRHVFIYFVYPNETAPR